VGIQIDIINNYVYIATNIDIVLAKLNGVDGTFIVRSVLNYPNPQLKISSINFIGGSFNELIVLASE
jgi:hypothetical protein